MVTKAFAVRKCNYSDIGAIPTYAKSMVAQHLGTVGDIGAGRWVHAASVSHPSATTPQFITWIRIHTHFPLHHFLLYAPEYKTDIIIKQKVAFKVHVLHSLKM